MAGYTPDLAAAIRRIAWHDAGPTRPEPENYGLDKALKHWLGLPANIPIALQMHHGAEIIVRKYLHTLANPAPVMVFRKAFKDFYAKYNKQAFVIGLPYVHYRRARNITTLPTAAGTLAFPCQSIRQVACEFDLNAYADTLLSLPAAFHPVAVCMYWHDLVCGKHEPFLRRGIPVYTAGHIYDENFVANFYDILRNFRFGTSNLSISTSTILALEMDMPFFVMGDPIMFHSNGNDKNVPAGRYDERAYARENACPITAGFVDMFQREGVPQSVAEIVPTQPMKAMATLVHGCDEPLDVMEIRGLVFAAYFCFTPAGRHVRDFVLQQPDVLHNNRYEKIFEGHDLALSFCRCVTQYPELHYLAETQGR
ncbi:MAG: hypothetical protein EBZ69_02700 [Alphaproteobacteria bacterium]|nr:hypothetical protein [Alphaproteobacteria bacterium]NDC55711.1 hypothetical protein [Alphaproteobacteria bacterium]NDG04221.1 hypothetical protein [Alphaproteobacteria bacterium]